MSDSRPPWTSCCDLGTIREGCFSDDDRGAASGYPQAPRTGDAIEIQPGFDTPDRWLVHAGTRRRNGDLVSAGGRVAAVVARDDTVARARRSAYEGVDMIHWQGMTARRDIGAAQRSGSFDADG